MAGGGVVTYGFFHHIGYSTILQVCCVVFCKRQGKSLEAQWGYLSIVVCWCWRTFRAQLQNIILGFVNFVEKLVYPFSRGGGGGFMLHAARCGDLYSGVGISVPRFAI